MQRRRSTATANLLVGALLTAAACSSASDGGPASPSPSSPGSTSATPSAGAPSTADERVVWLCRPDRQPDPCRADTTATQIHPDGRDEVEEPADRQVLADCFYAYPTVSDEQQPNADLRIQQSEREVAVTQASRFSDVCDVWSPIYRQRTIGDLLNPDDFATESPGNQVAESSLLAGWRAFLAQRHDHRPIVVIGHSQGASMLIRLLRAEVDPDPAARSRLALAVLLGGNVTVATGKTTGGSFEHLPLCEHPAESGCVIAYSSFGEQPPAGAFFGRPGQGVSALSGEGSDSAGLSVACVNPAGIGARSAMLHDYFPSELVGNDVPTPWTSYVDSLRAGCRHGDGATWLHVTATDAADDLPQIPDMVGGYGGYHLVDVNLAIGDLVDDVAAAARTWQRHLQ